MRRNKESILREIMKLLLNKRIVHYREIMKTFGLPPPTAYRYCVELESRYPDVITYSGGKLILYGEWEKLPSEVKVSLVASEVKSKLEKLKNNHLSELEKLAIERELEELRLWIEKQRRELGNLIETVEKELMR